jgi:hypothetical protein
MTDARTMDDRTMDDRTTDAATMGLRMTSVHTTNAGMTDGQKIEARTGARGMGLPRANFATAGATGMEESPMMEEAMLMHLSRLQI